MSRQSIALSLGFPFQNETNTGYGILAKTYLDAAMYHLGGDSITLENVNDPMVQEAKRSALSFVGDTFSSVKLPNVEVERGFRFWDAVSWTSRLRSCQVMAGIRCLAKEQGPNPALASSVTSPDVIDAFERADRWLSPMRP